MLTDDYFKEVTTTSWKLMTTNDDIKFSKKLERWMLRFFIYPNIFHGQTDSANELNQGTSMVQ